MNHIGHEPSTKTCVARIWRVPIYHIVGKRMLHIWLNKSLFYSIEMDWYLIMQPFDRRNEMDTQASYY